MMKSIKEIMDGEHLKILRLLKEFKNQLNEDRENASKIFNNLYWNLEKHFFIEEKVIFSIFSLSKPEKDNDGLLKLLKEHKDILFLVERIQNDIDDIGQESEELKETLINHVKFEDEIFYPRLDKELDELEKQLIFERVGGLIG